MTKRNLLFIFGLMAFSVAPALAQDTLRYSASEFIDTAIRQSAMVSLSQSGVDLAENRYREARLSRYVPRFELQTAHGLVPGVMSTSDAFNYPEDQAYLDPSLRNDWNNWGFFTRVEVTALQPIYTWGAINNAIAAAKQGANIARFDQEMDQAKLESQLFELYQSRLLSLELHRLVESARGDFDKAQDKLKELLDDPDSDLRDADLFKFELFKQEFEGRAREVEENLHFVEAAWNVALGIDPASMRVALPEEAFLDPIDTTMSAYPVYESIALQSRLELKKASAAEQAARHGLDAAKAQRYPSLFMAFTAAYAKTPNRPRQANPFIINSANYESIRYGIGFRQNLNFNLISTQIDRSKIQVDRARDAHDAATTGIRLDLLDTYKNASISLSRLQQTNEMLQISNEWLRLEQINYDYDIGEIKDLVDAVQKNLELQALQKQRIYEWNVQLGRLTTKTGLPITTIYSK